MSWWTDVALDGIASGVIGGLVTGGAVWLTIRHERRVRAEDRRQADLAELRTEVAAVLGLANRGWMRFGGELSTEQLEIGDLLYAKAKELQARAAAIDPGIHDVMQEFTQLLVKAYKEDADVRVKLCRDLTIRLECWFAGPELFGVAMMRPWANGKLTVDTRSGTSYLPVPVVAEKRRRKRRVRG